MKASAMIWLLSVAVVSLAGDANAGKVESEAREFVDLQKGKQFTLRPSINQCPKVYLVTDSGQFYYEHRPGRLFPVREPVTVTISGVSTLNDLVISFRSEHLGKSSLTVASADGSPVTEIAARATFARAFQPESGETDHGLYIGNRSTHTLHVDGCNHVPNQADVARFNTVEESRSSGYKECPICFYKSPSMSGFEDEYLMGQRVASMIRDFHTPITDDAPNQRVKRIGTKVLENWPTPLKGYDYKFTVIASRAPNAIACPAGEIFITTAMLDAVESDAELEGILAHEVTHVEMRHGYRQLKAAKRAQTYSAIAGILGGVIVGAASKDNKAENAGYAAQLVTILGDIASAIALSGYSRGFEEEADSYALAYMSTATEAQSTEPFVSTLQKLSYYSDIVNPQGGGGGLFTSHPNMAARVAKASQVDVKMMPNQTFRGMDADGETVATLTFDMQSFARYRKNAKRTASEKDELRVFATLETTQVLGKPAKVMQVTLQTPTGRLLMDNKEDTEVLPSDLIGFTFSSATADGFIEDITGVTMLLPNVDTWEKE